VIRLTNFFSYLKLHQDPIIEFITIPANTTKTDRHRKYRTPTSYALTRETAK